MCGSERASQDVRHVWGSIVCVASLQTQCRAGRGHLQGLLRSGPPPCWLLLVGPAVRHLGHWVSPLASGRYHSTILPLACLPLPFPLPILLKVAGPGSSPAICPGLGPAPQAAACQTACAAHGSLRVQNGVPLWSPYCCWFCWYQ